MIILLLYINLLNLFSIQNIFFAEYGALTQVMDTGELIVLQIMR